MSDSSIKHVAISPCMSPFLLNGILMFGTTQFCTIRPDHFDWLSLKVIHSQLLSAADTICCNIFVVVPCG